MNPRCARGFTLIEVVVALTLLAVILAGLIGALATFARSASRVDERTLASDDVRLVYAFLRQSLGEASPRLRQRPEDSASVSWLQGDDARLEWLPLETLCYRACEAENHLSLTLAPGAQCLGWDVTALGWMPERVDPAHAEHAASSAHAIRTAPPTDATPPPASGRLLQHLEIPGVWLERGTIAAADQRLLHSPLGLAGYGCLASVFFASGTPLSHAQREAALDAARAVIALHPLAPTAGATSPHPQLLLARMLAPQVEPAMALARALRAAWRAHFWQLPATAPRVWAL